ncbi:MAG TPA: hypothetical protein VGP13_04475 [Candidatus Paceibacterota bacterium]|nr:hypothetical protein [Candidatus Paceibacterota bacterium]
MKRFAIIAAILVVLGYGLFEARRIISGPELAIDSPIDGTATSSSVVTIVGTAQNISFLSINDKPFYTDEAGKFVYRYSPPPGYTIVVARATDRFGRRAQVSISFNVLTYCPI